MVIINTLLILVELNFSQDSINTYKQLSFKKTMELENMKKQMKELEGNKHSLEKKIDEGVSV